MSATEITAGSYVTAAFSAARFTFALKTPSAAESFFSMRAEQAAHVIPLMRSITVFLSSSAFGKTVYPSL